MAAAATKASVDPQIGCRLQPRSSGFVSTILTRVVSCSGRFQAGQQPVASSTSLKPKPSLSPLLTPLNETERSSQQIVHESAKHQWLNQSFSSKIKQTKPVLGCSRATRTGAAPLEQGVIRWRRGLSSGACSLARFGRSARARKMFGADAVQPSTCRRRQHSPCCHSKSVQLTGD